MARRIAVVGRVRPGNTTIDLTVDFGVFKGDPAVSETDHDLIRKQKIEDEGADL
jgi:hypothetical protein